LLSLPQAVSVAMVAAVAVMAIALPKVLKSTLSLSVIACSAATYSGGVADSQMHGERAVNGSRHTLE
jgi:hypothetical protein